jgi:hypothetical protein
MMTTWAENTSINIGNIPMSSLDQILGVDSITKKKPGKHLHPHNAFTFPKPLVQWANLDGVIKGIIVLSSSILTPGAFPPINTLS